MRRLIHTTLYLLAIAASLFSGAALGCCIVLYTYGDLFR